MKCCPFFLSAPSFRLPDDKSAPVILVGPGTGIAPFKGFCDEMAIGVKKGAEFGNWTLFHGSRTKTSALYIEELHSFRRVNNHFKLRVGFSREKDQRKVYHELMWIFNLYVVIVSNFLIFLYGSNLDLCSRPNSRGGSVYPNSPDGTWYPLVRLWGCERGTRCWKGGDGCNQTTLFDYWGESWKVFANTSGEYISDFDTTDVIFTLALTPTSIYLFYI